MEHRMKQALPAALLLSCALLLIGCAQGSRSHTDLTSGMGRLSVPATAAAAGQASPLAQTRAPEPSDVPDLAAVVEGVAPDATLGAVLVDRRTGRTLLEVNSDQPFYAASLVKLLIAMDALDRSPVDQAVERQVFRMLAESNDDIASAFWGEGGGPAIVTHMAARIGLTGTAPPSEPSMWGYTLTTPRDMVRTYEYLMHGAPERQREVIVRALGETQELAADGWRQYDGIPDGMDRPWAVKQGWGNTAQDEFVHSTGLVGEGWRYVVVLMVQAPAGEGWASLRDAVTAAAEALESVVAS
jgi:hypothetical protein